MTIRFCSTLTLLASAILVGCATEPVSGPVEFHDFTPRIQESRTQTLASFECGGALPAVHRQICASEELSRMDRALVEQQRERLQGLDTVGALLLEANHRQWLLSRGSACGIESGTGTEIRPDGQAIACLQAQYRQRARRLAEWPQATSQTQGEAHAYASYVDFRLADSRDAAVCTPLMEALNNEVRRNGVPVPARLPGVTALAGSNGPQAEAVVDGTTVRVELHNAGVFGGYQTRARGLTLNGQAVMDDRTLPRWIAEQPNYGGRAHASSSQTGDYGSMDLFRYRDSTLLLVNESWGFYSPAARGESAFSGVYRLAGQQLQQLCLFQTYLTPPRTNTLAGMPVYAALQKEMDNLAGDPLPAFAQHERRDNFQAWKEQQWTLLNLPLLGADAMARYGREAAVRERNDLAMDAFFNWSERNLSNKVLYRRVMPLLQPAHQELVQMYGMQGLDPQEARNAADLLFLETTSRAMENLAPPTQVPDMPLAPQANYRPRFAIAPVAGELEQGRNFATLYSVLLNNAPGHVVSDFIAYETRELGNRRGRGPDESPALMAAVAQPGNLQLLLRQGFDPNDTNLWGKSALMTASQLNHGESVRLLLERGATVHQQTKRVADAGVGGPDRREAAQARRTALLLAAENADAELIDTLVQAGAAAQAWDGYHQQVCNALDVNSQLSDSQRSRLKAPLCAAVYTPPPAAYQPVADLRAGDVLTLRDDGVGYQIRLLERPAMSMIGRSVQMSPERLRSDIGGMARQLGVTAVRRGKMRITGPLTLVFNDLSKVTPESLPFIMSLPVDGSGAANVGNLLMQQMPEQQVLSVDYDAQQADAESTWRALYSAALTNGFTPTAQGYVVIHSRGAPRTEYQLVVTE